MGAAYVRFAGQNRALFESIFAAGVDKTRYPEVHEATAPLDEVMMGGVTALCPGLTKTEFQRISNSDAYAGSYPSFAWLDIDDVAGGGLADVAKGRAISIPGSKASCAISAHSRGRGVRWIAPRMKIGAWQPSRVTRSMRLFVVQTLRS